MPGINPVTGPAAGLQAFYDDETSTGPETAGEPPLACYVFASCRLASARCTATRPLRLHLLSARHERIVDARAYVDRRRVAHRHGRWLHWLRIGRVRAGSHVIRVFTRSSNGVRRLSVRHVRGCAVSRPQNRVLRRA
jgi:hypothetical protein